MTKPVLAAALTVAALAAPAAAGDPKTCATRAERAALVAYGEYGLLAYVDGDFVVVQPADPANLAKAEAAAARDLAACLQS